MEDALEKLERMSAQMTLEPAEEHAPASNPHATAACGHTPADLARAFGTAAERTSVSVKEPKKNSLGIHHAIMPGGQRIALLKTMLTTVCERNCNYCPFRKGRDFRRATFRADEMASVFAQLHRSRVVEGLFLSSGVAGGGPSTQDRLIDTIDILRRKQGYRGYVHLKLMPGTQRDQVHRAMQLADRLSINLEAPTQPALTRLAPMKVLIEELLQPLKWAAEIKQAGPPRGSLTGRWPSLATQFMVGPGGESDVDLLAMTQTLNKKVGLQRAYFSAFRPLTDTPFENLTAENPWREHRLYQASFLLRDYGFEFEDLPFGKSGHLPLDADPKVGWARMNLTETPVEVNKADRRDLLRVPGIGPRGVEAILRERQRGTLRELGDLRKLGVLAQRAAPFVLLDGRRPPAQLALM